MAVVNLILLAGALLLLIPSLVVLVEIVAGVLAASPRRPKPDGSPRVAVLVPAHDEESMIAGTLGSIQAQLQPNDRVLVVADNCTDATAEIAAGLGAQVVTRTDATRRGKGYAVEWGVRHLAADAPDVVVIVDADCELAPGCIARISAEAVQSGSPVQANYELLLSGNHRTPGVVLSTFAFSVRNTLRPRGLRNLGLPCQLMGTGMAFPWPLLAQTSLSQNELAEDLVWGLQFAKQGHAPRYCEEARITSAHPLSVEGQRTQRTRWEGGHLGTIRRHVPRLLLAAVLKRNIPLLALVLDAAVPPLALHGLCVLLLTLLTALWVLLGGSLVPFALMGIALVSLAATLVLAWTSVGRGNLTFADLMAVPAYALSKIPLYAQIVMGKNNTWTRTKRD